MKKFLLSVLTSLALSLLWIPAQAAPLNVAVPANAYINIGNLDWAWAAPCSPTQPSCGIIDLSFQGPLGWRLPSAAEFASHPVAADFLFPGANVPNGGTGPNGNKFQNGPGPNAAGACAAAYFSSIHKHCDWQNGLQGLWANPAGGSPAHYESLVVRVSAIPLPFALPLFGAGLVILGFMRRRNAA
ncbi:MAG: hypothetical protein JKY12_09710 [Sneathiella sp.]|nr:hypothetical protein [Sneathiella sp.]